MRRALCLAVLALAGCGGDDRTAGRPAATPTVTAATASPSATATPRPSATATAQPGRRARPRRAAGTPALDGAVQRYLEAVNAHDLAAACAGFTRAGQRLAPVVCGVPGRPGRVVPVPLVVRVGLAGRPRVHVSGRRARAIAPVTLVDEEGTSSDMDERLQLRLIDGRWSVSRPSLVFFRTIGRIPRQG